MFTGFGDFILATLGDLEDLYLQLPGPAESNKTGAQGPFTDIQSTYWSRTEIDASRAPVFSFLRGDEAPGDKNFLRYGWAVRFGDSPRLGEGAPAPVPTTAVAGNGFPGIEVGTMVAATRTGAGSRNLNSG